MKKYLSRSKRIFFASMMAFSVTLAGCGSSEQSSQSNQPVNSGTPGTEKTSEAPSAEKTGPKSGGSVTVRTSSQVRSFGYPPEQRVPTTSNSIASPALETLGRNDVDGKTHPWLAKSWETDPANLTIKIKLEEGIKFHDNKEFNAEAVKWNIEKWIEAKRAEVANIATIEVIDSHNLKLGLKRWENSTLDDLFWMVQMVSPSAFEKNGKDWMANHPVGTGPFKFESLQSDVEIKYVKNENYWKKGLPYLDSFTWKIIPDPNTAKNTFLGKEVDINLYMSGEVIEEVKNRSDLDIVPLKSPLGLISNGIISNSANPNSPFANVKVRQALGYALDKKAIAETIFRGYVTPTNQFGAPSIWTFNPEVDPFDYNPEKAKQLLAEAGYANGFNTKLTGQPQHKILMQAIQGQLAEIGIKADLSVVESAKYTDMSGTGWDGLMIYAYSTDSNLTGTMKRHFGPNSAVWGPNIAHPETVHQLISETAAAPDEETRVKKTHELQKAVFEEHALVTSLYVTTTPYLKYPWVHDDGFYSIRGNLFTPESMWVDK